MPTRSWLLVRVGLWREGLIHNSYRDLVHSMQSYGPSKTLAYDSDDNSLFIFYLHYRDRPCCSRMRDLVPGILSYTVY